jgi:hypothetical protein
VNVKSNTAIKITVMYTFTLLSKREFKSIAGFAGQRKVCKAK